MPDALDRRTEVRLPLEAVDGIREVRLKYGPPVSLINLSRGGALLHAPTQLRPGVTMVLELLGERAEAIPFKVLRCEVARIGPEGAVYRGACQFTRPLQLAALQNGHAVPRPPLPTDKASAPRAEIALRRLLLRHREELAAAQGASFAEWMGRLPHALRSIQAAASSADPLGYALRELLAEIVPALDRGEPAVALRARLESHLRRTIPNITVAIATSPLQGPAGTESIYFAAGEHDACEILNVSLPADWTIPDWQFRLLQAGSQLLEILSAAGAGLRTPAAERVLQGAAAVESSRSRVILPSPAEATAEATPGWQKIVVRYRDGNLLKGFTHDFHPSRTQFSLWSSLDAPPSERKHIPVSQLKAVFFVRDFAGNPGHQEQRDFDGNAGGGRRLEVTFADGEQLVGSTLSYRPDGVGFFVIPADPLANNQRVFVVTGAVLHLRFL